MRSVVEDSTNRTPLVFVLSPGVDPTGLFSLNFYILSIIVNIDLK